MSKATYDTRYNGWSDDKNRFSPKNGVEAHAHNLFDLAYRLYQASQIGTYDACKPILDEITTSRELAARAARELP